MDVKRAETFGITPFVLMVIPCCSYEELSEWSVSLSCLSSVFDLNSILPVSLYCPFCFLYILQSDVLTRDD